MADCVNKFGVWVKYLALSYKDDGNGYTFLEDLKNDNYNDYKIVSEITKDPLSGIIDLINEEEIEYEE